MNQQQSEPEPDQDQPQPQYRLTCSEDTRKELLDELQDGEKVNHYELEDEDLIR
jgi:hypothetical protein